MRHLNAVLSFLDRTYVLWRRVSDGRDLMIMTVGPNMAFSGFLSDQVEYPSLSGDYEVLVRSSADQAWMRVFLIEDDERKVTR
jgi:hypothetical protein